MAEEKKSEPQSPKKAGDPEPVKEMSEKEQMEAYEESLKDTDWGHQPCWNYSQQVAGFRVTVGAQQEAVAYSSQSKNNE